MTALRLLGSMLVMAIALAGGRSDAEVLAIEPIALSGTQAAGGGTYLNFEDPRIDAAGRVLFLSGVADAVTSLEEESVYLWPGTGSPLLLAREKDTAPGFATARFSVVRGGVFFVSERGAAFGGELILEGQVTGSNSEVLWAQDDLGAVVPLAREGDVAPGTGGSHFTGLLFDEPLFGGSGWAFESTIPLGTSSSRAAIFRQGAGVTVEPVAFQLDPAVGAEPRLFCSFRLRSVNAPGDLLFYAVAAPTFCGTPQTDYLEALWIERASGVLEIAVGPGDPAPDVADAVFASFNTSSAGFNDAREFAILATSSGPGVDSNAVGIWGPDGAGGLRLVARLGSPAPDTDAEAFTSFSSLALDGSGGVVIKGRAGTNATGLWYAPLGGALRGVAILGYPVPGLPAFTLQSVSEYEANALGQVVFEADFRDQGITREGLWRYEAATDTAEAFLLEGDFVEVAPGDTRTLGGANILGVEIADTGSGGQDGQGPGWNDAGQLAAVLRFADESQGVFRVLVPEPGSAPLAAFFAIAALRLLRSRESRVGCRTDALAR